VKKLSWLLAALFLVAFYSCSKDNATEPNTDLFIPRAFTPDGDGLNDSFIVKGTNISQYHIEIFDDSKTPVYISSDINHGWDGRFKGKAVPAGNYLWVIEYTKNDLQNKETGYVELIR
jgi:gliding motility-associated-like protein